MVQNLKQLVSYDLIFIGEELFNIRLITESCYLTYKKGFKNE